MVRNTSRPGWLYCKLAGMDNLCGMPVVVEHQLRALAALRKPMPEDQTDALLDRLTDAREDWWKAALDSRRSTYQEAMKSWRVVLADVRAALTGKQ
jgi:hypothetical protein